MYIPCAKKSAPNAPILLPSAPSLSPNTNICALSATWSIYANPNSTCATLTPLPSSIVALCLSAPLAQTTSPSMWSNVSPLVVCGMKTLRVFIPQTTLISLALLTPPRSTTPKLTSSSTPTGALPTHRALSTLGTLITSIKPYWSIPICAQKASTRPPLPQYPRSCALWTSTLNRRVLVSHRTTSPFSTSNWRNAKTQKLPSQSIPNLVGPMAKTTSAQFSLTKLYLLSARKRKRKKNSSSICPIQKTGKSVDVAGALFSPTLHISIKMPARATA